MSFEIEILNKYKLSQLVANNPAKYPYAKSLFEGPEKFNLIMDLFQKNATQKEFLEVTDTFCKHSKDLCENPLKTECEANKVLANLEKVCSNVLNSVLKH